MMAALRNIPYLLILMQIVSHMKNCMGSTQHRVIVGGASGYIGRVVVKQLVARGVTTAALVRSDPSELSDITLKFLEGAEIIKCDVLDATSTDHFFLSFQPTAVICCLASRSGLNKESWAVDYGGGLNMLQSLDLHSRQSAHTSLKPKGRTSQFVLLSAFCCGKPVLQFQFAKLKLEEDIRRMSESAENMTHSIVRPTAYFKSLDGQIESAKKGSPLLYFGDGSCATNAICEVDLADYLVDCALDPLAADMLNQTRDIGGPDVPPVTKRQQGEMIYDVLNIPKEKRSFVSIPLGIFDILISAFSNLEMVSTIFNLEGLKEKFEDAAEVTRIVRYYASEPMVALGKGEVQGRTKLSDHFRKIAARGGELEEIDPMTTTAGVLNLFTKNEYVK